VLAATPEADDALCCFALPPVATFAGDWFAAAEAVADCSVGALWTVDCACPPDEPPPFWVCVTVWLVLLSLLAVAEAVEELVC
jgi:hypothetical protein